MSWFDCPADNCKHFFTDRDFEEMDKDMWEHEDEEIKVKCPKCGFVFHVERRVSISFRVLDDWEVDDS